PRGRVQENDVPRALVEREVAFAGRSRPIAEEPVHSTRTAATIEIAVAECDPRTRLERGPIVEARLERGPRSRVSQVVADGERDCARVGVQNALDQRGGPLR